MRGWCGPAGPLAKQLVRTVNRARQYCMIAKRRAQHVHPAREVPAAICCEKTHARRLLHGTWMLLAGPLRPPPLRRERPSAAPTRDSA